MTLVKLTKASVCSMDYDTLSLLNICHADAEFIIFCKVAICIDPIIILVIHSLCLSVVHPSVGQIHKNKIYTFNLTLISHQISL